MRHAHASPARFGLALAATVAIGYAACTALFRLLPEASATFMQALFHGMDFRPLAHPEAFTFSSFLLATGVLAVWAFALGTLFAWLLRKVRRLLEGPGDGREVVDWAPIEKEGSR